MRSVEFSEYDQFVIKGKKKVTVRDAALVDSVRSAFQHEKQTTTSSRKACITSAHAVEPRANRPKIRLARFAMPRSRRVWLSSCLIAKALSR